MKIITGYLIDRETGLGIPGKTVSFELLDGSAVSTTETYDQEVDSITDANGRFSGWFELSPGPVNVQVDVSVDEIKVRKHDEMAQMGVFWSSDGEKALRGMGNGIIPDFLNQMSIEIVSGHQYRINTGGSMIAGKYFSLENGPYVIDGDANPSGPANPRIDLITLRQWKESASGQDSGKQEIVVTNGVTSDVIPTEATGYDADNHDDLHIGGVSTVQGGASKTVFSGYPPPFVGRGNGPVFRYDPLNSGPTAVTGSFTTINNIIITGLNPQLVYDGFVCFLGAFTSQSPSIQTTIEIQIDDEHALGGESTQTYRFAAAGVDIAKYEETTIPLSGITGVDSYTYAVKLRATGADAWVSNYLGRMALYPR